jgi:hypothetical protein
MAKIDDDILLTKEEINLKRNKEMFLSKEQYLALDVKMSKHSDKHDFFHTKVNPKVPGQYFLYEIFKNYQKSDDKYVTITYPQLGIYLNSYPCDQTIEVEWVDSRRTWEWNVRMSEHCWVAEETSILKYLPLWSDQMMVYGVWDSRPNWKQLKQAYEKTWWFYRDSDELRDIQLNRILNEGN